MAGAGLAAPFGVGCNDPDTDLGVGGDRPVERKHLSFDLSLLRPDREYVLELGMERYVLERHTPESRTRARSSNAMLAKLEDRELTHYIDEVALPADAPQSYIVTTELDDGRRRLSLAGIHVPAQGIAAARTLKGTSLSFLSHRQPGLGTRELGGPAPALNETDLTALTDFTDAARWLVYHHPDVLSLDPAVSVILLSHIDAMTRVDQSDPFSRLIKKMKSFGLATDDLDEDGWARAEWSRHPVTNALIPQTDEQGVQLKDRRGRPAWRFHYEPNPDILPELQELIVALLNSIRSDEDLEGTRFFTPQARSTRAEPLPDPTPGVPATRPDGPPPAPPIDLVAPGLLQGGAEQAYTWTMPRESNAAGQTVSFTPDPGNGRMVRVTVENSFNRHLGVFFAYLDAGGNPLRREAIWKLANESPSSTDWMLYGGVIDAPPLLMGIPLGIKQTQTFRVAIPPGVSRLAVLTGAFSFDAGDYRPEYRTVDHEAITYTLGIEYGLPTAALAFGASFTAGKWKTLGMEALTILGKLVVVTAAAIPREPGKRFDYAKVGVWLANEVIQLGIARGGTFALMWAGAIAAGAATKGIPVLGTALFALQAAETAAVLARTTVEIGMAKVCSETQIASTNAVRVVVSAKKYGFPQTGRSYRLLLTPLNGDTLAPVTGAFSPVTTPSAFTVDVPAVLTGGKVHFVMEILAESGAVVGRSSGEFQNVLEIAPNAKSYVEVATTITNSKITIDGRTRYSPRKRLAVEGARHKWIEDSTTPLPGSDLACSADTLCEAVALTVGGEAQMAYAWKESEQLTGVCGRPAQSRGTVVFTMQNVNLNVLPEYGAGDPDATLKNPGCGELAPTIPLYRVTTDGETPYVAGAVPDSLVLEASSGTYHLRTYRPTPTSNADPRAGASWGRLRSPSIRGAAIHKSGVVLALSGIGDKLELLTLRISRGPTADRDAPESSLRSGPGSLVGYLSRPVAICATTDTDSFIVLEDGNKRMQAFGSADAAPDTTFFAIDGKPSAIFPLADNRTYLDIAYEPANKLIYVLSRGVRSAQPNDFVLDIYARNTGLVASTSAFVARKLALDDNQNVYALGWNTLLLGGRREPDVWLWIPSVSP
ncbi:MAG: hypothetical protein KF795_00870 [Labilithrix sp.]|nr:hypothetical protein [Labilithrix sp.]